MFAKIHIFANIIKLLSMNYSKWNNIVGWIVWAIATYVYVSTIEPTASFWDCGEFIATAYRLEVGHPPGAPLFMLIARFFTLFASPENAAVMVNILSALSSSFTILFLYWTITLLAKKIALKTSGELTKDNIFAIIGSGVVGALAYTFTESVAEMHPFYAMRTVGGFLFFTGACIMLYNVIMTLRMANAKQKAGSLAQA